MTTVYQPIVATLDGRITGVETLLRWAHPTRGMVGPSILIPLAEHSGAISAIGHWVLGQASAHRQRWQSHRPGDDLAVSVNVSAHEFMAAGFVDTVAAVLYSTDTAPGLLTLDVTESVLMADSERALVVLKDLKAIGVMLALDDFGTGYSSLSYLKRFPVDIVKVDRSFVAGLGQDSASHLIIDAVVHLAHQEVARAPDPRGPLRQGQ
jgi:EAL domain-containing protein (putative c-di-GMP-specific phosphodiesterase class I)